MKKQKGISLVSFAIYVCIFTIIIGVSLTSVNFGDKCVTDKYLQTSITQLDEALAIYYGNHSGSYPVNLTTLQTLGLVPNSFSLTEFTYTVNADRTLYKLTVTLNTGTNYVSPNSKM